MEIRHKEWDFTKSSRKRGRVRSKGYTREFVQDPYMFRSIDAKSRNLFHVVLGVVVGWVAHAALTAL